MSTTIFYFTGTDNSLKVARDLAKELGDANIISIPKVIDKEFDLSAERIGIIYPVYMFGMPLIVRKFIEKLKTNKNKYIFAIVTYGGMVGNTLGQNVKELATQGLKLSAGFAIRMPGNYTPLYEAVARQKQNKMFAEEAQRIKEIAKAINQKWPHKIAKGNFIANFIFSEIIYNLSSPKIPIMDKKFWADEKCTSCGICVKVCPVNNIELSSKKPRWLHNCEQCFACLHWCPQESIQYGKKTLGRKRYRNPEIKLEDLIKEVK
ncbi:MAG: EFR1 family ferrodoxin [Candidatus Omnitrophota bacterium]|nr:EFR1 family ferrodoxin [Candidatus Omnitrophota bacterium]